MNTADTKPKTSIAVAWVFLLLSSGLPKIILQEVFGYQVSFSWMSGLAGVVILLGWLMAFLWNTSAEAEPVPLLGIKPGERWATLGRNFALIICLGTLAFLVFAGRPPLDIVMQALPFLPAVLIAAMLNAFNEEMPYKASFLSVLEGTVGKHQALWLMAAYSVSVIFTGSRTVRSAC